MSMRAKEGTMGSLEGGEREREEVEMVSEQS